MLSVAKSVPQAPSTILAVEFCMSIVFWNFPSVINRTSPARVRNLHFLSFSKRHSRTLKETQELHGVQALLLLLFCVRAAMCLGNDQQVSVFHFLKPCWSRHLSAREMGRPVMVVQDARRDSENTTSL